MLEKITNLRTVESEHAHRHEQRAHRVKKVKLAVLILGEDVRDHWYHKYRNETRDDRHNRKAHEAFQHVPSICH